MIAFVRLNVIFRLYLVLVSIVVVSAGSARRNTLILERSADDGSITAMLDPINITEHEQQLEEGSCVFDGGEIVLSHPMDLNPQDKWFKICNYFQKGYELMVDYINSAPRCGLTVQGKNYGVTLRSYEGDGSKWKASAIAKTALDTTDFFLAPYTSSISNEISAVAHEAKKIMIAPGSYFTWVYEDRPGSFGVLPLPEQYLKQVVPMLAAKGAKTVQTVFEGGPGMQCESARNLTEAYGMITQREYKMEAGPTLEDFIPIAYNMSRPDQNPDVVITCTYDAACSEWLHALRNVSWAPKAQVFSICIGMETFEEQVGTDAEYLIGTSPWVRSLNMTDAITGWTPEYYAKLFEDYSGRDAAYHSAIGQATVSVLAQAIEASDSLTYEEVSNALQTMKFDTVFGKVVFDQNGQNEMDLIATQYTNNMTVNVVYPPKLATGNLVYPMPGWPERDCVKLSPCNEFGSPYTGVCNADGTCQCNEEEGKYSFGEGETAACHYIPDENMTYVSPVMKGIGYFLCVFQIIASLGAIAWTFLYRKHKVVSLSQPIFLHLVSFGCLLMILSIIPLGMEGDYRYEKDPDTPGMLDMNSPSSDTVSLDAACMAFPWLIALGFSITFSALFAKIVRVRTMMKNAMAMRRTKVGVKEVLMIMVVVIAIEFILLLSWQLVAPLKWNREVVSSSDLGYATTSAGMCSSNDPQKSIAFALVLFFFNLGCIVYALVLCYQARNIKFGALNEGKYITASVISILQILVIAVPISVIASENTSASFFVKSIAVFITTMAVTSFIFVPKMYNLHFNDDIDAMISQQMRRTIQSGRQSAESTASVIQDPSKRCSSTASRLFSSSHRSQPSSSQEITHSTSSRNTEDEKMEPGPKKLRESNEVHSEAFSTSSERNSTLSTTQLPLVLESADSKDDVSLTAPNTGTKALHDHNNLEEETSEVAEETV